MTRKGHVPPDRTKRYALVEIPTAGPKAGVTTRVFGQDLSWDDANAMREKLSAQRVTKFATIIDLPTAHRSGPQEDYADAIASVVGEVGDQSIAGEFDSSDVISDDQTAE